MEWCVDNRVLSAVPNAEVEIAAHLARHAVEPSVAALARADIREMLDGLPAGMHWVSLDWENEQPLLMISPLSEGPLPGTLVAPGVSEAHLAADELASRVGAAPAALRLLAVSRALEGDLDPHPRGGGGAIAELPGSLLGTMTDEVAAGRTLEDAAARTAATLASASTGHHPLDPHPAAIAQAFIEIQRQIGGDFRLLSADNSRAVLANRRCPFGPSARPALCRFTSALAGGLAARAAGGAEVTLDERLALGDRQCRLILDVSPPTRRLTSHHYTWPPAGFPSADTDQHPVLTPGFRISLSLRLPRDRLSVPVTRRVVSASLREVGVIPDHLDDVELALSEACANVIDHSGPGDIYEVSVALEPSACHIRVIDLGRGFDFERLGGMAAADAEHGRGVALMHALVDRVRFESQPERGTIVHLVKQLDFDDTVPARQLMLESFERDRPPDPS